VRGLSNSPEDTVVEIVNHVRKSSSGFCMNSEDTAAP
jgi:hypothetical protein